MKHAVFSEFAGGGEFAFVHSHQLAASIDGSAGDRGYYLNRELKVPTIVIQKTGTVDDPVVEPFTKESYLQDATERAKEIRDIVQGLGLEQVVLGGDSAGATDSLALAATGILTVKKVIAIDPGAMRDISRVKGFGAWAKDNFLPGKTKVESDVFAGLEPLPDIRPSAPLPQMARRMLKEMRAYSQVFRSNFSVERLDELATMGVPVDLILADHSSVMKPEDRANLSDRFLGSSVQVDILSGAVHGFSNPHRHFVHLMRRALAS